MSTTTRSKRRRARRGNVHKANGVLHPRVQKAKPERFGIVCVDVGKAKSDWILCDFYGKILVQPTEVFHNRCGFGLAIAQLREAISGNSIRDHVVAALDWSRWNWTKSRKSCGCSLGIDATWFKNGPPFVVKFESTSSHKGVLQRIVTWAGNAALVQTPYVLLLSHPGINVVTAGELAGEMGPISHYANAKAITGRAGLFPSRYQSADVDLADGKIIRCSNRRLRNIIMMSAL